ncbi:redoxin domain-containing protein [Sphingomonas sp.]|uniref:redoxin domain-containing protein n=1 Tax=Sphingomonas sp. TaxID=28214 RepID=UPI003B3A3F0C
MAPLRPAPEWDCSAWLNTETPLSLAQLRGRPIVAAAFQMLCPGCVEHTIPQLRRVRQLFHEDQVAVLGLHSVFEHHDAMGEASLRAFLHEYKIGFPVAIDRHGAGPVPETMRTYGFQGTPTLMLIDAAGMLRRQTFGHIPDLQLGAEIMSLLQEQPAALLAEHERESQSARCEIGAGIC